MDIVALISVASLVKDTIDFITLRLEAKKDAKEHKTNEHQTAQDPSATVASAKKNTHEQEKKAISMGLSALRISYFSSATLDALKEFVDALKDLITHGSTRTLCGIGSVPIVGQIFVGIAAMYYSVKLAMTIMEKNPYALDTNPQEHALFEKNRKIRIGSELTQLTLTATLTVVAILAPPIAPILAFAGFAVTSAIFFGSAYYEKKIEKEIKNSSNSNTPQQTAFSQRDPADINPKNTTANLPTNSYAQSQKPSRKSESAIVETEKKNTGTLTKRHSI